MTFELTAIEIVFLVATFLNFMAVARLDRTRQLLKDQTDVHATEASKYQDLRINFQRNYDQALQTTKIAVDGFNRISNSMEHFMKEGSWPQPEKEGMASVTPLPSRAPTPNDDGDPPAG